jgi:hypothetical protein
MQDSRLRNLHYNTTNYIGYGPRSRYRGSANPLEASIAVLIVFALAYLLTR